MLLFERHRFLLLFFEVISATLSTIMVAFRYSLSVLKIYSACYVYYKFSVLVVKSKRNLYLVLKLKGGVSKQLYGGKKKF